MADKRESRKTAAGSRKPANKTGEAAGGLTDDERAAMREHIAELKAAKLGKRAGREDNERAVLEKIYPGREVRAALLWTDSLDLAEVSASALDAALAAALKA